MKIVVLALTLALLGAVTPIGAEESADFGLFIEDSVDRFQLWNTCGQIGLLVENLRDEAIERGLREEDIATTVRSRLRGARLYGTISIPILYVNVYTLSRGIAFDIGFNFRKMVFDPISGKSGVATTWERGTVGLGYAAYILSVVSQLTDEFIDEYLRVNEPACSRSPIGP